jgi:decaprenyl-phosphate phosphoribosyltransferase
VDETASGVRSVKAPQPGTVHVAEGEVQHSSQAPGLAAGLLRTARPRQWVKNLLVFAAPGAAGVLTRGPVLGRSLAAFGIFCLAASGTYFMNDAFDRDADRLHPGKRLRPVASGAVGRELAAGVAAALLAVSVALGGLVLGRRFALAVGVYAAVNLAYSGWLKREPVLDLAAVASGFLIRAVAGGLATGVPLSDWFMIVASFGSLFMVAGKREAELQDLEENGPPHRGVLAAYSRPYLRFVRTLSAGVAITAYCLWAFEKATPGGHRDMLFELTIVPVVLAILRYSLLLEAGEGGAPEDVVLRDWRILVLGLAWIVLFAAGVYGA